MSDLSLPTFFSESLFHPSCRSHGIQTRKTVVGESRTSRSCVVKGSKNTPRDRPSVTNGFEYSSGSIITYVNTHPTSHHVDRTDSEVYWTRHPLLRTGLVKSINGVVRVCDNLTFLHIGKSFY